MALGGCWSSRQLLRRRPHYRSSLRPGPPSPPCRMPLSKLARGRAGSRARRRLPVGMPLSKLARTARPLLRVSSLKRRSSWPAWELNNLPNLMLDARERNLTVSPLPQADGVMATLLVLVQSFGVRIPIGLPLLEAPARANARSFIISRRGEERRGSIESAILQTNKKRLRLSEPEPLGHFWEPGESGESTRKSQGISRI